MISVNQLLGQQIAAAIRAGGFPHIAALAFGVGRRQFENWRRLGRHEESDEPFRSFARDVDEAIGQSRLRAEMSVFTETPKLWLQHGPGRETEGSPGWTSLAKPIVRTRRERNVLLDPEAMAAFERVFAVLADHPELRERVASAVVGDEKNRGDS